MTRAITILFLFSSLLVAAPPKFEIDDAGRWSLGFRYWSNESLFQAAGSWAFLAEVTKLGPKVPPMDKHKLPRFRSGTLKVHEFLNPKAEQPPELAGIRELLIGGADGLKIGDRVIVFVDQEPYEGGYVINFHGGGCRVGIRLGPPDDPTLDEENLKHILKALREGRTELRQLSSEEIGAWIAVDVEGVAYRFKMELEAQRLQWKVPKK